MLTSSFTSPLGSTREEQDICPGIDTSLCHDYNQLGFIVGYSALCGGLE